MSHMTRVDVQDVPVIESREGPVFQAHRFSYVVKPNGDVWFIMRDKKGQAFASAQVTEERCASFMTELMLAMGATISTGKGKVHG